VKRMLLTTRALTEAMRGLAYSEAVVMDLAHFGPEQDRPANQRRIDLMIPVIKGWLTEVGQELTSVGVQVHGGMGYVEETGAAQYLRDVRITSIYEGTNGIQAADLVNRKLGRDSGATMEAVQGEIRETIAALKGAAALDTIAAALEVALAEHVHSTARILAAMQADKREALGASFDYMMQTGYLFGGWQLARGALVAQAQVDAGSDRPFYARKVATATYYAEQVLPRCAGHALAISRAGGELLSYPVDWI